MRRLVLLGLLAAIVMPACAARRITVAQLEETLASATAQNHPDFDVARLVGTLELSERLTDLTLARLSSEMKLQPRTALAVQLLADQSAFLDPPPTELPATGQPDAATQERMLQAARTYAVETWTRLPNFFVTRSTIRFDDTPQVLHPGEWPVRVGLHPVGSSSRQVTFRDGKEVQDASAETTAAKAPAEIGLHSWGEFGPALSVVLSDMANHTVKFDHWEKTAAGLAAVYRYDVPREASHYAVTISYLGENVLGRTQFGYGGRERSPHQVANIPKSTETHSYSETPAYHGNLAIDPATGAVLRITIETDLKSGNPLLRAATVVQYGPVVIGDRQFICPIRSLAVSMEEASMAAAGTPKSTTLNGVGDNALWQSPTTRIAGPVLLMNETRFVDYHRLGSTMRVITDSAANDASASSQVPSVAGNTSAETPVPNGSGIEAQSIPSSVAKPEVSAIKPDTPTTSSGVPPASPTAAAPAPVTAPSASTTPVAAAIPEISMSAATGVPDIPSGAVSASESGFSLKVTSRLVDVGVVAYDKKGRPVTDLKSEDFEIYDNGHKQQVHFFSQAISATQPGTAAIAAPEATVNSFSNRAPDLASLAGTPAATQNNATVLLVDESHIAWKDLNNARSQMLKFLGTIAPGERVGLYSMSSLGFRVLVEITSDHANLVARLKGFMPKAQSASQAQDEETRNRQQFDEVHNVADLNSVNGNHNDVPDADQPVDPQLLTMGSNPERASLVILQSVARHLSSIGGHKNLVWVSSDNVFADWQDQSVGIDKGPKSVESFALRAQEAMNDAHVAVYPFDVSQLETAAITADLQHQNVQLTPAAEEAASLGGGNSASRSRGPGRLAAEESQDLHPIQGSIRQVAAATGGRTIRRSGDLASELTEIVDDGHATYQLSFSPQGPADDQYHAITVKLTGRRGLTLRYRTGYLFAREPTTLKDRFQQAVWRPLDVSEIAITADVAIMSAGASVKVNIAAGDLGMEEQAGRWLDKLDIFFIQRDDAGLHAHVEGQTLGLRLKSSTYQSLLPKGVPFEHAVSIRPGMASLRVLVVDENSGRMGSVTIPALDMEASH